MKDYTTYIAGVDQFGIVYDNAIVAHWDEEENLVHWEVRDIYVDDHPQMRPY